MATDTVSNSPTSPRAPRPPRSGSAAQRGGVWTGSAFVRIRGAEIFDPLRLLDLDEPCSNGNGGSEGQCPRLRISSIPHSNNKNCSIYTKHFLQSVPSAAPVKSSFVENGQFKTAKVRGVQSHPRRSCGTHNSNSSSLPRIHPSSDSAQVEFTESTLLAAASHIRIVLSCDPDTIYRPSGEYATDPTPLLCPLSGQEMD